MGAAASGTDIAVEISKHVNQVSSIIVLVEKLMIYMIFPTYSSKITFLKIKFLPMYCNIAGLSIT